MLQGKENYENLLSEIKQALKNQIRLQKTRLRLF